MALGLDYRRMMGLVILPQALTLVIPGIVNNFIGLFKDTTLVSDRRHDRFSRRDRQRGQGPGLERSDHLPRPATPSPALFYFVFCYAMSRYSASHGAAAAPKGGSADGRRKDDVGRSDAAIEFIGVHKWYGAFHVLRNINLTVGRGERIVVCGPSGSGKSTLIRCVNRLEEHQRGVICVDGVELTRDIKRIDEVRREVGMVFQSLQPVSASDGPRELHAGADLGAQDAEARGRGAGDEPAGAGQDSRAGRKISRPTLRRPAAARRHRPRARA